MNMSQSILYALHLKIGDAMKLIVMVDQGMKLIKLHVKLMYKPFSVIQQIGTVDVQEQICLIRTSIVLAKETSLNTPF